MLFGDNAAAVLIRKGTNWLCLKLADYVEQEEDRLLG